MLTHKLFLDPTNMGEARILVEVELDKLFPKFDIHFLLQIDTDNDKIHP